MKSIEDTLVELDERILAYEEDLADFHRDDIGGCAAACEVRAQLEELRDLRLWVLEC